MLMIADILVSVCIVPVLISMAKRELLFPSRNGSFLVTKTSFRELKLDVYVRLRGCRNNSKESDVCEAFL